MADTKKLFTYYTEQQVNHMLNEAIKLAKENPKLNWGDLQKALRTGTEPACIIQDWLSDEYKTEPRISKHWIRRGRIYLINSTHPTFEEMAERMRMGYRTAFLIMIELQKKGLVGIKSDLSFDRLCRKATKAELIRQLKVWGKKYHGRCEPELLMRLMYVDFETAQWLSKYGNDKLGFKRKYMERI